MDAETEIKKALLIIIQAYVNSRLGKDEKQIGTNVERNISNEIL